MGLTPLFELFAGPLSFRLANYVQRRGWGCSSEKSNPRSPKQTGVNRTVHALLESCTVFKVMYNNSAWSILFEVAHYLEPYDYTVLTKDLQGHLY